METEALATFEDLIPAAVLQKQVALIQDVMKNVMKEGEHFGIIPGCEKPSLLKPGAEKLSLTFRLAPTYEVKTTELAGGHREYFVICTLRKIQTEKIWGQGVGSCSTMESKYRFRNAEPEITDRSVPGHYWQVRRDDPEKARDILGGKGFVPKKVDGQWLIAKLTGEKVEYDNPADYYNTVLKMAKKRAHVDAILTATAASDIFTQDMEEQEDQKPEPPPKANEPTPKPKEPDLKNGTKTLHAKIGIAQVTTKAGKDKHKKDYLRYVIKSESDVEYYTWQKAIAEDAKRETKTGVLVEIDYLKGEWGNEIIKLSVPMPEPEENDIPL